MVDQSNSPACRNCVGVSCCALTLGWGQVTRYSVTETNPNPNFNVTLTLSHNSNPNCVVYRGDVSSGVSDRVLSQLLTELDGVHVSLSVS